MADVRAPAHDLAGLGLSLPANPPAPGGAYVAVRVAGGVAYVASQFPIGPDGRPAMTGRLGRELTTADGVRAAELTALNVLAHVQHAVGLGRVLAMNRFEAYVASAEGWDEFPAVLDGASRVFLAALGPEAGAHARAPVGAHRLPWDMPLELTASFTLRA